MTTERQAAAPQATRDGRLTLRDGRTLAWCEYGPADGTPLLRFQGTPGSRFSRYPRNGSYEKLGVRVVMFDRPGFGASTRLPERGISVVADDAAELLDYLGLERVHAIGASGGGPHVLALGSRHPDRVRAATVVVGGAQDEEEDVQGLIGLNRKAWYAARTGWQELYDLIAPIRDALVGDPLAQFREIMDSAPASDAAVMQDADWQGVFCEDIREALRTGAEGWTDEGLALSRRWDFDPAQVSCSVTWWHGEDDPAAPISAVKRLLTVMDTVDLRVWSNVGHLEPFHRHDEIVGELLSR